MGLGSGLGLGLGLVRRLISYCVRVRGAAGEGCGGEGDG